jgi:hypothetical protein
MNSSISDGETQRAECTQIAEMLERVANFVQSRQATSGTITDRNGLSTTSFTYTPTAPH